MIPAQHIIAWSKFAPWGEQRQIEQDLIIARAIVALFSDPFLSKQLRFRGGTALNKLFFNPALRYSEDIDLVRTQEGPSKPIWDKVHEILNPWLGQPEYMRSPVAPALRYTVEPEDKSGRIRLKVEINEVEIQAFDAAQTISFKAENPWFSGAADIPTFSIEEILATKLRALLQRNKGRDLVDLSHALAVSSGLDPAKTVELFGKYMAIPRWEAEKRMFEKLERKDFLADVRPLLTVDEQEKFDIEAGRKAFIAVFDRFVGLIPGKEWASTEGMLEKHKFAKA